MSILERYRIALSDLKEERAGAVEGSWWAMRLDKKILDMAAALAEK